MSNKEHSFSCLRNTHARRIAEEHLCLITSFIKSLKDFVHISLCISRSKSLHVLGYSHLWSQAVNQCDEGEEQVIATVKGDYISNSSFENAWKSYMQALSKAAGHPIKIRSHDLRHSFCSWVISKGADVHVVSEWMGHSTPAFTQKVYDHISQEREENSINLVEGKPLKSEIRGQNGGQDQDEVCKNDCKSTSSGA